MEETRKAPNPGCWITFVFAAIMWVFTLMYFGVFQGDNYLTYGILLTVSLPFWVKSANMYYATGNPYDVISGHFYMVFGILFGGFVGFGFLGAYLGHIFPTLAQDERIMGVMYLIGGLFLLPLLPSNLYLDKVTCVTWLIGTVWLITGGIWYFRMDSMILYYANMVCCTAMTLGVTWMMINETCIMTYGKGVPMGKPFKSYPEE